MDGKTVVLPRIGRVAMVEQLRFAGRICGVTVNRTASQWFARFSMAENRPSHRPQLSDLRDSGSIEQDADVVAFIHREDLYTKEEEWAQTHPGQEYPRNIAEIIVAKNRKGPTGSIRLEFRDHLVRFDPVSLTRIG